MSEEGANLEQWQIDAIMAFVTCKGKTNDETLKNMSDWFKIDWEKTLTAKSTS